MPEKTAQNKESSSIGLMILVPESLPEMHRALLAAVRYFHAPAGTLEQESGQLTV